MRHSETRILTSHVGSLPRPDALIAANRARELEMMGREKNLAGAAETLELLETEINKLLSSLDRDSLKRYEFAAVRDWKLPTTILVLCLYRSRAVRQAENLKAQLEDYGSEK